MKKALIALGLTGILLASSSVVKANDFVVEPESDTAVSYAAFDILGTGEWETTFVNYCKANGEDEYWIRLAFRGKRDKVLHYCTLIVDGEKYRLTAVPLDDKHYYAAQGITVNRADVGKARLLVSPPRFFDLSRELAAKIMAAKEITIIADRATRINTELHPSNKMMEDIHHAYSLRYANFSENWKPRDTAAEKAAEGQVAENE